MTVTKPQPYPSFPSWLMREHIDDVIRRRLGSAREPIVRALTLTSCEKIKSTLEAGKEYALLALHPLSEESHVRSRIKRFGQSFPALFSMGDRARPHDVRKIKQPQPAFIGGVETRSLAAPLLLGAENPSSIIHTNCFLRMMPDTSIVLARLRLQSEIGGNRKFDYKIFFVYVMAFGEKTSPL